MRTQITARQLHLPLTNKTLAALVAKFADWDTALDRLVSSTGAPPAVADIAANAAVAQAMPFADTSTFILDIPDAVTSTYLYTIPWKLLVVDAWVVKQGAGAGNTVQVQNNAATAVTDAMAAAVDKAVSRAASLDFAAGLFNAGDTMKVVATKAAGTMAAKLFIRALAR